MNPLIEQIKTCMAMPATTDTERRVNHVLSEAIDFIKHHSDHFCEVTKMAKQPETLIGCPHCEKSMCDAVENDYGRWQIFCGACGSSSGTYKTREEAVDGWNRRVSPSEMLGDIDSIAHAVCPVVKPWMDHADTPAHPCKKCKTEMFHGEPSYPCCLAVCRDIAKAAMSTLPKREMVALTDTDKQNIVGLMTDRAAAMGEISLRRSMGEALSALLSDPRYEIRRCV